MNLIKNKMDNDIEKECVYRIEESTRGFVIQKKNETKTKKGFLPWSKWKTEINWVDLDDHGKIHNFMSKRPTGLYDTKSKAEKAIEKFKKYPIYHYEIIKNEFTESINFNQKKRSICNTIYTDSEVNYFVKLSGLGLGRAYMLLRDFENAGIKDLKDVNILINLGRLSI